MIADAKGGVGRLGAALRTTAVRIDLRVAASAVALVLAYLLVLLAHGLLPGLTANAPDRYLTEGAVQCVHDLGIGALKPWCHDYGEPLGYPLLTNGPLIVLGALLVWIPGVGASAATSMAVGIVDALALAGAFALMRRLGARYAVALVAAVALLLSPTILGLAGFPGTFMGFALLPAYAFVDLWAIDAVRGGRRRVIGAVAVAYLAVKGGGLFMDGYSFVVANVLSALLWARWLLWGRPTWRAAATGLAIFVGANVLAVLVYRAYVPGTVNETPLDLFRAMGLDATTLVLPTDWLWPAAALGLATDHSDLWGDGNNSAFNYVGVLCVVLAGVYLAGRPRAGEAVAIALAGAIALVAALGPSLKVDDVAAGTNRVTFESYLMPEAEATWTFPWDGVYTAVTGLEDMRATYRWFGLTRLALVVLAALAVERLLRHRRWWVLAVVAGGLAAIELAPNLPDVVSQYRANDRQVNAFKSQVVPELRAVTDPGDRAFFVNYDGTHNDFLVNYLAAAADVPSYNAGGDKNATLSQAQWPPQITALAAAQPSPDSVVAALSSGRLDVVILPLFHLRWSSYNWPPTAEMRSAAQAAFVPITSDSRLRVDQRSSLAAVRLATPA